MIEIISVRFSSRGRAYYFDPSGLSVNKGDFVVVDTAKGLEFGECVQANRKVSDDVIVKPLRPVVRVATDADKLGVKTGKEKEAVAFEYCQKKIDEFELDMKLVDVEFGFEGNKILFFFTSEGRVDFRRLVKDLAAEFHSRIELRQIGVRDEAKMIGGLGMCGKPFCCSQFLTEFHPVSIKMAKVQGLSLNPTKISGTCGRLMCCLKYEENAYEDLTKKAPKIDAFVDTPAGKGSVVNVNLLRGNAKVRMENGIDTTLKSFAFDEINVLGGKGRRAEYFAAKAEGRLEEAGFTADPPPVKAPLSAGRLTAPAAVLAPSPAPFYSRSAAVPAGDAAASAQGGRQSVGGDRKRGYSEGKKKPAFQAAERQPQHFEPAVKAQYAKQYEDVVPPPPRGAKKQSFRRNKGGYKNR